MLIAVGDTIVIGDWAAQRFSTWLPDGKQLLSIPVPAALRGAFPQARDAAGRWYFEIGPVPGLDGSGLRDSSAVVRSDVGLTRFDTVARLAPQDVAQVATTAGTRLSNSPQRPGWWGVERDGTLWIARATKPHERLPVGREAGQGGTLPDRSFR